MVKPACSNRAIFGNRVHAFMLNERRLDPFEAHKSWLPGGVIASLSLMSTMSRLPLVVGLNACDVYDVLTTDR